MDIELKFKNYGYIAFWQPLKKNEKLTFYNIILVLQSNTQTLRANAAPFLKFILFWCFLFCILDHQLRKKPKQIVGSHCPDGRGGQELFAGFSPFYHFKFPACKSAPSVQHGNLLATENASLGIQNQFLSEVNWAEC